MELPVIIMLGLGAIFVFALVMFLKNAKKKPVDQTNMTFESRQAKNEPVSIEMKDAAAIDNDLIKESSNLQSVLSKPKVETKDIQVPEKVSLDEDKEDAELVFSDELITQAEIIPESQDFGSIFEPEDESVLKKSEEDSFEFVFGSSAAIDQEAISNTAETSGKVTSLESTPEALFDSFEEIPDLQVQTVISNAPPPPPVIPKAEPKIEVPSPKPLYKPVIEEEPEAAAPAAMDPEEEKAHEKAKRIARVIINDIRNYNPEKLAEGIRTGNIMSTLGIEIERGRQLYIKRVAPEIAKTTNYYREALIKILADGRSDLFGW